MATLDDDLWRHNLTRVRVVDASDDYRRLQPPMPSDRYPALEEVWLPTFGLARRLSRGDLVEGFLYDWHEAGFGNEAWVVGVVSEELTTESRTPEPPRRIANEPA